MQAVSKKICSRDGCDSCIKARGLCNLHYRAWLKLKSNGFKVEVKLDAWARIKLEMPGTYSEITKATGLSYKTVSKIVSIKHDEGLTHIQDHEPPGNFVGSRWTPIFADGPGKDHVVSKRKKKGAHLSRRREVHRQKMHRLPAPALPMNFFKQMG